MCPHRYFLEYNLGLKYPANIKADKGSVVHLVMELLASEKLARQNGMDYFDDYHFGRLDLPLNLTHITNLAYNLYATDSVHEWTDYDYKDVVKWVGLALTYNDGMFHPHSYDVVSPEAKFDLTIEEPWAKYSYTIDGKPLEGYLGLKGVLDFVVKYDSTTLGIIDYKTGAMVDWANGARPKTYKDFQKDNQLRLYHLAASKLYPWASTILVTIFYVKHGAFTLCFDETTIAETKIMVKQYFDNIRKCVVPKLRVGKHCGFCQYNLNKFDDDNLTICERVKQEVVQIGLDEVVKKRGKVTDWDFYGSGGGKDA